jgi:hypothetical protein
MKRKLNWAKLQTSDEAIRAVFNAWNSIEMRVIDTLCEMEVRRSHDDVRADLDSRLRTAIGVRGMCDYQFAAGQFDSSGLRAGDLGATGAGVIGAVATALLLALLISLFTLKRKRNSPQVEQDNYDAGDYDELETESLFSQNYGGVFGIDNDKRIMRLEADAFVNALSPSTENSLAFGFLKYSKWRPPGNRNL